MEDEWWGEGLGWGAESEKIGFAECYGRDGVVLFFFMDFMDLILGRLGWDGLVGLLGERAWGGNSSDSFSIFSEEKEEKKEEGGGKDKASCAIEKTRAPATEPARQPNVLSLSHEL